MVNLSQHLRLGLRLTPQQVQYLEVLQLPTLALGQRIKTELELNPILLELSDEIDQTLEQETPEAATEVEENANGEADYEYSLEDYLNDDQAGYKSPERVQRSDDEETYEPPIPFTPPLSELLLAQFRLLDVDDTDMLPAEEIIGKVDEDGYLRRELSLIVQDLNLTFGLSIPESKAEAVLQKILQLDPPGIAARDLRECLLAQIKADSLDPVLKELAQKVIELHIEDFKLKRFDSLAQKLHVGTDTLRKVIDALHHLNPRPGEGKFTAQENYVTPDFIVEKDDGDFIITLNDRNIPPPRTYLSPAIERLQGWSPEEYQQFKLEELMTPASVIRVLNAFKERLREGAQSGSFQKSAMLELDLIRKDKSIVKAEVTASFLLDDAGHPIGVLGVTRDITERYKAEQEKAELRESLARSKKMEALGTLAGGVAHDLNNVLSGIVSYPDLLLLDLPKDSTMHRPIEVIQASGKKAAAIVQDLHLRAIWPAK